MQQLTQMYLGITVLMVWHALSAEVRADDVVYLEQGWDHDTRMEFYTTSITSEMLPLSWFQALEQADSGELFGSDENMRRYGYLPGTQDDTYNPDALPLGFAREDQTAGFDIVRPFLSAGVTGATYRQQLAAIAGGRNLRSADDGLYLLPAFESVDNSALLDDPDVQRDYSKLGPFIGPNCAACHTTEISYHGTRIRIDGGTTLADRIQFSSALADALLATCEDDARFTRFAGRLRENGASELSDSALRVQLKIYTEGMLGLMARNSPPAPFGPGRMDAFGLLYNEIVGMTIQAPENYRVSNAPVSYPPLWNVPTYDWFQWNCCVNNPMIRNVIEVLGAFGRQSVGLNGDQLVFASSVRLEPLQDMWDWMETLRPPQWPREILGQIDAGKAARGREIYLRENCQSCHADQPPYPQTDPNSFGRRFVRLTMTPCQEVGTDPLMAENFAQRTAETGLMKGMMGGKDVVSAFDLFGTIGGGVMTAKFKQEQVTPALQETYFQQRETQVPDAAQLNCYKAEPLAGIWATSPYLHNGSVPNLYELLLPPVQRRQSFFIGDTEYDPVNVGLQCEETPGAFEFDTTVPGNSNSGHDYGTGITDAERRDLIEYLKTL